MENKSSILVDLFTQIDSIICETTFNYIENFKQSFENDFIKEENRIKNMFREISKSLDNLEKIQLEALKKSRDEFLYNKFDHVFKEAEITKKYYSFYKESKSQCIYNYISLLICKIVDFFTLFYLTIFLTFKIISVILCIVI